MRIEELNNLEKIAGCTFKVDQTGSVDWTRAYILMGNVQIGRISFFKGEATAFKYYKKWQYRNVDDPEDRLYIKLHAYIYDKIELTNKEVEALAVQAKQVVAEDMKRKYAWRFANPKFGKDGEIIRRRGLQRKNSQHVLLGLLETRTESTVLQPYTPQIVRVPELQEHERN